MSVCCPIMLLYLQGKYCCRMLVMVRVFCESSLTTGNDVLESRAGEAALMAELASFDSDSLPTRAIRVAGPDSTTVVESTSCWGFANILRAKRAR
jgi:hypothetical protein